MVNFSWEFKFPKETKKQLGLAPVPGLSDGIFKKEEYLAKKEDFFQKRRNFSKHLQ